MMRRRAHSTLGSAAVVIAIGSSAALGAFGAVLLVPACSSFGASDTTDSGLAPQRDAVAPDATCTAPTSLGPPAPVCASCKVETMFSGTSASAVIASGGSLYAMVGNTIVSTDNLELGTLAPFGSSTIKGSPKSIGIDGSFLYVGTTEENVRLSLTDPSHPRQPIGDLLAAADSRVLLHVGDNDVFQTSPTGILFLAKVGSTHGAPLGASLADAGPFAFEGDVAYAAATNTADAPVLIDVTNTVARGALVPAVVGLVVRDGYAYVAESPSNTVSTTISRLGIAPNDPLLTREPLARDDGTIEHLTIDTDRLYWVANRAKATGAKVLVSSDLCGGDARMLAHDLPDNAIAALSFDATYVYLSTVLPGPIERVKK